MRREQRAQSTLEAALFFPILILLVGGLVDAVLFGLEIINLTAAAREAARFGADGDPRLISGDPDCNTSSDFYVMVACIAEDSLTRERLTLSGPNDDIVISAVTYRGGAVVDRWPSGGGWSRRGTRTSALSNADLESLAAGGPDSGLLVVEVFHDHDALLSLALVARLIPGWSDPIPAYGVAIMPLPAMAPW